MNSNKIIELDYGNCVPSKATKTNREVVPVPSARSCRPSGSERGKEAYVKDVSLRSKARTEEEETTGGAL